MPTSPTPQFTDFTRDVLGRYICNGLDEALRSTDKNARGPDGSPQSDARPFDIIVIGGGCFGPTFFPPKDPEKTKDSGNRGLVFAAYQTSITEQFEFVQAAWANNPAFKDVPEDGQLVSGHDLIIGQNNGEGGSRERRCPIHVKGQRHELVAPMDWVIPTGGGYVFAPSISVLEMLAGG